MDKTKESDAAAVQGHSGETGTKNRKKTASAGLAAICLGAAVLVGGGCAAPTGKFASAYTAADVDSRIVQAYNRFGFELFREETTGRPAGENVFVSPASVAIALSMTLNGAAGQTRDEMARTLHVDELSQQEANEAARALQGALQSADPGVQLSVANSIWARKGWKFEPAFLSANEQYYDARTELLDFSSRKAASTINKWVSKQTNGRIDGIVNDPIDRDSVMLLLNAVYFKGDWTTPFDKTFTRDRPFTLQDDTVANRSTMSRAGAFDYADMDGYAAVRLPYGNGNTGMVALLPDAGTPLAALADRLAGGEWNTLTAVLQKRQGEVAMPRFKMEYEASLNEPLQTLGMPLAFDSQQADFSKLLVPPPNAYIGEVKHKTFVQVDEKGTEAAAVTKVEMRAGSAYVPTGFKLELNRPFLFVIHERQTGAVLFVGAVYDPQL